MSARREQPTPASIPSPDSVIVAEILAAPGYRQRLRRIRALAPSLRHGLAKKLAGHALSEIRRDPGEAIQCARLGAKAAVLSEDLPGLVAGLRAEAQAEIVAGAFPRALRSLNRAVSIAEEGGDSLETAELDALRIQPLTHLERFEEAEDTGRRTLETFKRAGDQRNTVRVRMALADLAFRTDRHRVALREYSRIEELLPPDAPSTLRGAIAANRANSLEAVHRYRAAERHFEIAQGIFAAAGADHTVAQIEYNRAYGEMLRGRYRDSLRRYARAEEAFARFGDERHLAHIDLDRAEIHLHLNLPADVREFAARAERRFQALSLQKESGQAAHLAGRGAELLGDAADAETCYLRAELVFASLGLAERRLTCVLERACLAESSRKLTRARQLADEAQALLGPTSNPVSIASIDLLRARLALASGKNSLALDLSDAVLERCSRIHVPWVHIEAHRIAGKVFKREGRLDPAIAAYRRAIELLERYRGGVPPDEYMAAFLSGRSEIYAEIVDLLVQAGDKRLAFEFTERAKSRALVDQLAGRRPPGREAARLASKRLLHLRERLSSAYRRVFRDSAQPDERSMRAVRAAREEAREIEDRLARVLREDHLRDPDSAGLEPIDSPGLDELRRDLEPDVAFLAYFVTDERLFTFVLTREAVHVVRQDVSERSLRQMLLRFHFHLSRFDRPEVRRENLLLSATRANLGRLAAVLLDPIRERLDVRRIVVGPHGILHHVPFHALPWGDGWVADRFEVLYAPSASVYSFCGGRRPRARGAPSIFALPDRFAPQIEDEAHRVAQALGSDRIFLGEQATLERLRRESRTARILHIATHGMFRHGQPMLSAIRLADRWMNLYDLHGMDVAGELVVLSTCESGVADVTEGNEILGLARGFLHAGAPALMTSQWRVNDVATTEFMDAFYRHLTGGGDAVMAHRAAMAEVRERRPHPYFWAPFFLTGRPLSDSPGTRGDPIRVGETPALAPAG